MTIDRARCGAVLIVLAMIAFSSAPARADAQSDAFDRALRRLAAGELAAIDDLVGIADAAPTSPWADDALAEAARGAETAGQLPRAIGLYRRIVAVYPDSRQARRAQARIDELERAIGKDGAWAQVAAEHDAILRAAAGKADPRPQLDAMAALVRAHPDYPEGYDARIWLGDTWLRLGEPARAKPWFDEAAPVARDPRDAWRARKASADAQAALGETDDAEAAYLALRGASAEQDGTLDQAMTDLDATRGRRRKSLFAWAALILAALGAIAVARRDAGSWRRALRGLARPPIELWVALPFAVILVGIAWRDDAMVGIAVSFIAGGGLAVAWLAGASLTIARARGPVGFGRAAAVAVAAAIAVVAIAYLAVVRGQLIDLLIETWKHGHERG
ncbi:MAG: hypothetical protein K8W52_10075 [Deltaproteobacteria bacterium]|nr:hypothetical protein [Deltaproteobacteria bacterium]